ncbi:MAG TPA: hypothetical protein VFH27_06950, partial [Longimicrobiaceae bacterium]|nr:hypothetical protein [Longimicrobiaceae bacterium]
PIVPTPIMEFPPPPPPPPKKPVGCLKIALIGCGALLLMSIVIGGGCAYWFTKHGDELMAGASRAEREGLTAAKSTDEKGCLALAEARIERDGAIRGAVRNGVFIDGCLRGSRETPGFCDGVPPADDFTGSTAWLRMRCQAVSLNPAANARCQVLSQGVQRFCTQKHEKVDPDSAMAALDEMDRERAARRKR